MVAGHRGHPGASRMRLPSWFRGVPSIVPHAACAVYCARMAVTRVACVGAIVRDDDGRLLLVRRGNDPGRGLWSVPGGRVEAGETSEAATAREVHEETGLRIRVDDLAGVVEREGSAGVVYVIEDFHARPAPDADPCVVRAGDDAAEVGWFAPQELIEIDCVAGLVDALRDWGVVP